MKKIIEEYYDIKCIAFIKISNKVFRIKTDKKDYILKYVDYSINDSVFAHLAVLKSNRFIIPIKNKNGVYLTRYDDNFQFYIALWYEDEIVLAKDLRLKYYLESLAILHNESSYTTKVNQGYYQESIEELENLINDSKLEIDNYLKRIEKSDFRSPVEWLYLINNNRIFSSIDKAKEHLKKYKELVKDKGILRVSITYQNFDYDNIIVKENLIVGSEKCSIAPPLFDLKDLFDKSFDNSMNLPSFLSEYINRFKFLDYEIEWLMVLIFIPILDFSGINEIEKIVNFIKTMHHISCAFEIESLFYNNDENKEEFNDFY